MSSNLPRSLLINTLRLTVTFSLLLSSLGSAAMVAAANPHPPAAFASPIGGGESSAGAEAVPGASDRPMEAEAYQPPAALASPSAEFTLSAVEVLRTGLSARFAHAEPRVGEQPASATAVAETTQPSLPIAAALSGNAHELAAPAPQSSALPGIISGYRMNNVELARDGDTSTWTDAQPCPCGNTSITLDLGGLKKITQVRIFRAAVGRAFSGAIDFSVDGSTWWNAIGGITPAVDVWEAYDVAFTARYVSLSQGVSWSDWGIGEFEVYGSDFTPQDPGGLPGTITGFSMRDMEFARDGDISTRAYSEPCPCGNDSITLDLGALKVISQVRFYSVFMPFEGSVQYSVDGSQWWTALGVSAPLDAWSTHDVAFTARYVKLNHGVSWRGFAVSEFEVYGTDYVSNPRGLPATPSGSRMNDVHFVHDGDSSTRAYTSPCPCENSSITLDLGAPKAITEIRAYILSDEFIGRLDYSLDGSSWTTIQDPITLPIDQWSTFDVDITARYVRLFHGYRFRGWALGEFEVYGPQQAPLTLTIADAAGNPVSGLATNADGWPEPNPVLVKATVRCPAGGATCQFPLDMGINFSQGAGRFHLYQSTLAPDGSGCFGDPTGETTYNSYRLICDPVIVPAGQSVVFEWSIWVQPSNDANMTITATYGSDSVTAALSIPQASIHPIVFLPGLGAMWPPEYDQEDNFLNLLFANTFGGYNALFDTLEKMGYEKDVTLFEFGYDWLQRTVVSAAVLKRDVLNMQAEKFMLDPNYVPWVDRTGGVQFDLIGHSTGNLITKTYIQSTIWGNDVNKWVSIAGPLQGLTKGYRAWEGLSPDLLGVDRLLFNLWVPERAAAAGYQAYVCLPGGQCVPYMSDETKYQFVHDPINGITILPEFLPTYTEVAYLINNNGDPSTPSGDFPFGRQANPLLEAETILTDPLTYLVYDPYLDNPNVTSVPPGYATTYYGFNTPPELQKLDDRVGMGNIYLVFGNSGNSNKPDGEPRDPNTPRQFEVTDPASQAPYWFNGEREWDEAGHGDVTIPTISANPQGVKWDDIPLSNRYDIDTNLQENNPGAPASTHTFLVGYDVTHSAVAEALTGLPVPFLPGVSSNDNASRQAALDDLTDSALLISAHSPVELTLTDVAGQRLGYDPASGEILREIPNSYYTRGSDSGRKHIFIYSPEVGEYTLTVTGAGTGDYTLLGYFADSNGSVGLFHITGATAPGQTETVTVTVPTSSGEVPNPPRVIAGPDVTADEGEPIAFMGTMTDVNPGDTHAITWDFGDGNGTSNALTPTHTFADDGNYLVTLTVTDPAGFVISDTLEATIANVAPAVEAGPDVTANVAEEVPFAGSFTDSGTLDTHTIDWDFGDGNMASDTLTPTHTFTAPGVYIVTLTVTDDDGGVGSDTLHVTVTAPPTPCTVPELTTLLADLHAQGQIEDETYEDLQERLEKAQRELDKGKPDKAADKLWSFVERVNKETRASGQTTPAAAAALKDGAFCILGMLGVDEALLREIESLRIQVEDAYQQGLIDKESVRDKLLERLEKAQERIVKGRSDKAAEEIDKFIKTVEKERGDHIDAATADELTGQAQTLANGLGENGDDEHEDGAEHDDDGDDEHNDGTQNEEDGDEEHEDDDHNDAGDTGDVGDE